MTLFYGKGKGAGIIFRGMWLLHCFLHISHYLTLVIRADCVTSFIEGLTQLLRKCLECCLPQPVSHLTTLVIVLFMLSGMRCGLLLADPCRSYDGKYSAIREDVNYYHHHQYITLLDLLLLKNAWFKIHLIFLCFNYKQNYSILCMFYSN